MDGQFGFVSGWLSEDRLELLRFRGHERISELFSFELVVRDTQGALSDDEIQGLFDTPCAIALGSEHGDVVRGIVTRVRALHPEGAGVHYGAEYELSIAPTLHLLTLATNNRVFQHLTVPDLVGQVLRPYGLGDRARFAIPETVRELGGPVSRSREYVVQYGETDWDFIQRWLEHEGRYYWFEDDGTRDVMVIGDSNAAATEIAAPSTLVYTSRTDGNEPGLFNWEREDRRVSARVAVLDYNAMTPDRRVGARAPVGPNSFGTVIRYGEHVDTHSQAQTVAILRAEHVACEASIHSVATNCARLHAGCSFRVTGHPASDEQYLVTAVDHVGDVSATPGYRATIRAIPIGRQFRPALRTPWPRIHGFVQGHIAAGGEGEIAMIDTHGRYRVKLAFDMQHTRGERSSMWIRLAEPYSGPAEGSHHPLRKGTEVLVAYVDGNPDRPVIVGTVPNPETRSPTTIVNPTQSVLRTASGIELVLEDDNR